MADLLTHFKTQFDEQSEQSSVSLKERQTQAFQQFLSLGLPTRKTENWKYTSIEPLKKMVFDGERQSGEQAKHAVTVNDGQVILPSEIPEGVEISDLFTALEMHQDIVSMPEHNEPFSQLNLALLQGGVFIRVKEGVRLETPIEVNITHSDNTLAHHMHHVYLIENGAKATIVESYQSDVTAAYFHNVRTDLILKDQATGQHFKLLNEGAHALHFSSTHASLDKSSFLESHAYSFGAALARSTLNVDLKEEGAECQLNGLYVLGDNQHIANYTSQNHMTPHATSQENYKGIVGGSGKAVFNGNIRVEKDAQKTNASLENKNILLSKKASVDTKPQLEIFADDVKCTHGTTVGQLDDKALFYLRSRGIPLTEARELLVHAFAGDLLEKIDNPVLKETLFVTLNDKLRNVA